jgi:hypothetical protein
LLGAMKRAEAAGEAREDLVDIGRKMFFDPALSASGRLIATIRSTRMVRRRGMRFRGAVLI